MAQGEPVREGQKMMQIPDLSQMLVNVRVHEAMVSTCTTKRMPTDKSTWQTAQIRVDAFPSRILHGHIKTVDTVASQQDWFASDVKVYKTMVSIDEPMEGLKPGMSAEVTIYRRRKPHRSAGRAGAGGRRHHQHGGRPQVLRDRRRRPAGLARHRGGHEQPAHGGSEERVSKEGDRSSSIRSRSWPRTAR